ncbi:MAG: hypothetical protein WC284_06035 [Candidimonas sp.]
MEARSWTIELPASTQNPVKEDEIMELFPHIGLLSSLKHSIRHTATMRAPSIQREKTI